MELAKIRQAVAEMRGRLDTLITQINALEKERACAAENGTVYEIDELACRVVDELEKRLKSKVPIEHALWSTGEIGEYLQRPAQVVRDRVVCLPGFPEAIRLPNVGGIGRAHPRWKAMEVIEWVESHQSARIGRPRKRG
ncbi:hypothetical protein OI25_614 [Paraburkholderia fungorum]|uniref:DNA-binding protein n=1 Tax=Paraburkholderia fungorum TaxID=134537 RepID=A0AAU8TF36_9BURK|nr:hypothetical protein [Paraburkholderia fungorum]AJZ58940.1 hypothetical protein OI25_614 [Paraburkholderia fungorum]